MSFRPPRWLDGPHAQTVFANLCPPPMGLRPRRERWELPDGDFVDVDRHGDPSAPTVVVLHGLEGSSRGRYVKRLVRALLARGVSSVAMNFRGCSGELNRLPRFYHSGETTDLAHAIERLVREQPGRALGVAGYSLGGNVAAKWFGEQGDSLPKEVRAGAVVSVPFDLAACARAIDGPGFWPLLYRERFLRDLRSKAIAKARRFPGLLDVPAVRAARTFEAFDDRVTAPLHGFASAVDYWTRCSAARFLHGVRRPLIALSAEDDPMVPARTIPVAAARENPHIELHVAPGGGHVGFVERTPLGFGFWAERLAADFLARHLAGG
jgi:predicted alpha/beta-fold hydrolase